MTVNIRSQRNQSQKTASLKRVIKSGFSFVSTANTPCFADYSRNRGLFQDFTEKGKEPGSARPCSDPRHSHRRSAEAVIPPANLRYQNPGAADFSENPGHWRSPVPGWAEAEAGAGDRAAGAAPAGDRVVAAQALAEEAVDSEPHRASGCGGMYHRIGEYNGYTWISPP